MLIINVIHTLGPDATDSAIAASQYCQQQSTPLKLQLHSSFTDILNHLDHYVGDQLIIPTAYQQPNQLTWGDLHYRYWQQLQLIDCFQTALQPMVLVKNSFGVENQIYSHRATKALVDLVPLTPNLSWHWANSKFLAYRDYQQQHGQYVITTEAIYAPTRNEQVLQVWQLEMIWCVYQISVKGGFVCEA